jgi:hypothetical protein
VSDKVLARFDWKYGGKDWRLDQAESFQQTRDIQTDYTVVDGQILKTVETTREFADAIAGVPINIRTGPPYLFADGSFRKDPHFIFQKTHIKTTTYEAFGDGAYRLTIEDLDVLTGKITTSVSVIDGKIPLAPTVKSALSNLTQIPVLGILDATCDYVDTKEAVTVIYAGDDGETARAAKRRMQRATAIVRTVKRAANPLIRVGNTVRLIDAKRVLDARHMVVARTITIKEDGGADMTLTTEYWTK